MYLTFPVWPELVLHFNISHTTIAVKNVDKEFAKELHATILKIYQDPNSNASKRLKKNGWFGLTIEQDELFDAYQENFDHTIKLLK